MKLNPNETELQKLEENKRDSRKIDKLKENNETN